MTTTELYSGINKLGDDKFKQIQKATEEIKKYPIYYVDIPGNVDRMKETILQFMENEGKGKWIIIILDHTLLVRNRTGESERETLSQLQYMFMELKKYGKNTIIQLSQMNRKIESPERIQNISMHYPMRTDVFGSESVYQASDLLFVLHRPELILKNGAYGPDNLPIEGLIYLHALKLREGNPGILIFENKLMHNRIDEADLSKYTKKDNEQQSLF